MEITVLIYLLFLITMCDDKVKIHLSRNDVIEFTHSTQNFVKDVKHTSNKKLKIEFFKKLSIRSVLLVKIEQGKIPMVDKILREDEVRAKYIFKHNVTLDMYQLLYRSNLKRLDKGTVLLVDFLIKPTDVFAFTTKSKFKKMSTNEKMQLLYKETATDHISIDLSKCNLKDNFSYTIYLECYDFELQLQYMAELKKFIVCHSFTPELQQFFIKDYGDGISSELGFNMDTTTYYDSECTSCTKNISCSDHTDVDSSHGCNRTVISTCDISNEFSLSTDNFGEDKLDDFEKYVEQEKKKMQEMHYESDNLKCSPHISIPISPKSDLGGKVEFVNSKTIVDNIPKCHNITNSIPQSIKIISQCNEKSEVESDPIMYPSRSTKKLKKKPYIASTQTTSPFITNIGKGYLFLFSILLVLFFVITTNPFLQTKIYNIINQIKMKYSELQKLYSETDLIKLTKTELHNREMQLKNDIESYYNQLKINTINEEKKNCEQLQNKLYEENIKIQKEQELVIFELQQEKEELKKQLEKIKMQTKKHTTDQCKVSNNRFHTIPFTASSEKHKLYHNIIDYLLWTFVIGVIIVPCTILSIKADIKKIKYKEAIGWYNIE